MSDTLVSLELLEGRSDHSAVAMIAACFRHQHPEAFGGDVVPGVAIPSELFFGRSESRPSPVVATMPEEAMGYPGARPLSEIPGEA